MSDHRTDQRRTSAISTARVAQGTIPAAAALALALAATPAPAQTWTDPAPLNSNAATDEFAGDLSPHVTTDGQGTWLAVWDSTDGALGFDGDILFARSTDGGATWSEPAPLNTNAATDSASDGPAQVTTDGMGTWVAAWRIQGPPGHPLGGDEDVLFARSTDGGATWSDPEPLDTGAASDSGDDIFPQVTTDGLSTWLAVWHSNDADGGLGSDFDLMLARSTDGGATWSDPAPLNSNAAIDSGDDFFPHVATDRLGHWVAIWESEDSLGGTIGTDSDILFARSTDGGMTWSDPEPLNSTAATLTGFDTEAQVVTDGQGTWLTVWRSNEAPGGTTGTDPDILFARSLDEGRTWSNAAPLNANATTDSVFDFVPRLATDGVGTWVAIWVSPPPGSPQGDADVLFARSLDGGATWSDPAPLNTNAAADQGFDFGAQLATDGLVTWVAVWNSDDDLGGTIGDDYDILFARGQGIGGCTPGATVLCLADDRFRVIARWRTSQGTSGPARAEPLTDDTGYFWFFNPANVEAVVKVLDACVPPFDRFWVFAGGLTNVEVTTTVVDIVAEEVRTYGNPLGTPFQPVQDTDAFATCAVGGTRSGAAGLPPRAAELPADPALGAGQGQGACTPDATSLCLGDSRFRVSAQWRTSLGTMGPAQAEPLTDDTGYFWFFDPSNVEVVVKVLDACVPPFDRFWVFAGGLTNVEVVTTVVDTETNEEQLYTNPLGMPFQPLQDTDAFATCP